jgi:uncharacterized protein YecT (DUF1311 family)
MYSAIARLRRRRQRAAALSVLLLVMLAGSASAQTAQEEGVDCKDAAGMELPETVCAEQAWQTADAELNRVYQRLRKKLPANGLEPPYMDKDIPQELASVQKLWVQLRDADCGLYQGLSGGGNTAHFNWQFQCYLDRTQKRIAELQALERTVEQ